MLAACLLTAAALWGVRHKPWPAGSRALLQLSLLLLGRFGSEFLRDPAGEPVAATPVRFAGLEMMELQWILLPCALLGLLGWHWRRTAAVPGVEQPAPPASSPMRNLLAVLGLLALAAALGPGALTVPEVMVVKALLLAVLVLEGGAFVLRSTQAHTTSGRTRLAALPLALASVVLLTSQVEPTPARSPAPARPAAPTTEEAPGRSLRISLGSRQGWYDESIVNTNGCGTVQYEALYQHSYRVAGGEVAYTFNPKQNGQPATVGLGAWTGSERQSVRIINRSNPNAAPSTYTSSLPLYSFNPFIAGERAPLRGFGFGYRIGLHFGELNYPAADQNQPTAEWRTAMPDFMLWLGARPKLFGQVDIGSGMNALGTYTLRQGIGTGLGKVDGRFLLGGFAVSFHDPSKPMAFLSGNLPVVKTGLSIEPSAASDFDKNHQFNFRFSYQLTFKKK
ncbi:hypothetical protein GCM10023185_32780 [Hymenobacter saemangeumensis]|uniref:Uncharacterized protein n=1 Tax=Hymenobacter saemangeumensis TaxID=1084522 RepID=A0ABP8IMW6_9BACT